MLVRNRAIGLNPVDWKFIEWGHPAWSMPHGPGVDGAGEVIAVRSAVQHLRVGMAVAYHNDLTRPGSFAEFTAGPARAAIALPSGISLAAAGTSRTERGCMQYDLLQPLDDPRYFVFRELGRSRDVLPPFEFERHPGPHCPGWVVDRRP